MKKSSGYFVVFLFFMLGGCFGFSQEKNSDTTFKKIHTISFLGTKKYRTSFLKNIVTTKTGAPLDSIEIRKSVLALQQLQAVAAADFTVKKDALGYKIQYHIDEVFSIQPSFGFWKTTNAVTALHTGVSDYNFLGRDYTLSGFYTYNKHHSYGVDIQMPRLFFSSTGIQLGYYKNTTEEPLYFDNQSAVYSYTNRALQTGVLYDINTKNRFFLGATFFKEKYKYLFGFSAAQIPQKLQLRKVLFKIAHQYNGLSYHYFYISGVQNTLTLQRVTTTSYNQDPFYSASNTFLYFKTIPNTGVFATRLQASIASNTPSPFAPFAIDNNRNIRGVGVLIDRASAEVFLNTEYRHTLFSKKNIAMQANAFVDMGTWRRPGARFSSLFTPQTFKVHTGIGFRILHKHWHNAILRLDYGHGLAKNSTGGFVFGIGQYF